MGWSTMLNFTAMNNGSHWSPRIVLFGDLGHINAQSLPRLKMEAMQGLYDAVFHIGSCILKMKKIKMCEF